MFPLAYELRRKTVHSLVLIFPVAYHLGYDKVFITSILTALLSGILAMELLRVDFGVWIPKPIFQSLFRRRERGVSGATFMFLGQILAVAAFPKPIAITVMCMTVLGDAASALVGKSIGKCRVWGPRNIEGITAEFLINALVGLLVFNNYGLPLMVAVLGALVATIVETVSYRVDDNLAVPLFAGIAMKLFIP